MNRRLDRLEARLPASSIEVWVSSFEDVSVYQNEKLGTTLNAAELDERCKRPDTNIIVVQYVHEPIQE